MPSLASSERSINKVLAHLGLKGKGFPNHLIGRYPGGELLIVGTGRNVWQEVSGLPELPVMTINDMVMYWPGVIRHAYSNDIKLLLHWAAARREPLCKLYGRCGDLHSAMWRDYIEYTHWPLPSQGGGGVVAILVALLLGYDSIVCAGMPFDNSGHFYDPPLWSNLRKGRDWSDFLNETPDRILESLLPVMRGKVKAQSGRLKDMLE